MKTILLIGLTSATLLGGNIRSGGVIKEIKDCNNSKKMSILKFYSDDKKTMSSIAMCKNKDGYIKVFQTVKVNEPLKKNDCTLSFSADFSTVTEKCGDKKNVWVDGKKI